MFLVLEFILLLSDTRATWIVQPNTLMQIAKTSTSSVQLSISKIKETVRKEIILKSMEKSKYSSRFQSVL